MVYDLDIKSLLYTLTITVTLMSSTFTKFVLSLFVLGFVNKKIIFKV